LDVLTVSGVLTEKQRDYVYVRFDGHDSEDRVAITNQFRRMDVGDRFENLSVRKIDVPSSFRGRNLEYSYRVIPKGDKPRAVNLDVYRLNVLGALVAKARTYIDNGTYVPMKLKTRLEALGAFDELAMVNAWREEYLEKERERNRNAKTPPEPKTPNSVSLKYTHFYVTVEEAKKLKPGKIIRKEGKQWYISIMKYMDVWTPDCPLKCDEYYNLFCLPVEDGGVVRKAKRFLREE